MPSCVFRKCINYYDPKVNKTHGISYHTFPTCEIRLQEWIAIVRKQRSESSWTPSKSSRICSNHFKATDKYTSNKGVRLLKNNAVPVLETFLMVYKWCVVPKCTSTSIKTPEKLFVPVPIDPERRKKWLILARRNPGSIGPNSSVHMCEDHFNMEKDVVNYMKFKLGFAKKILVADGAFPSKFDCQQDRKRRLSDASTSPDTSLKRQKQQQDLVEECEQENVPHCSESPRTSFQPFEMIKCDKMEFDETEDPLPDDVTLTESVPDNQANKNRNKRVQKEDLPPSDNVLNIKRDPQLFTRSFCKHCSQELQHTKVEDQTKVLIARVYHYFECEYEELKQLYDDWDLTPLSKFRQRTALATGVSETTVLQILKEEESRNAEKREEPPEKRRRARKRPIQTESSSSEDSSEDSSDDSDSDGGQPSNVQEAQNEAEVETLVVKLEPECDTEQVQINTDSVQVKAEPPDDDVNNTSETLAVTEPAAAKRRGRKSMRKSDVTSPRRQTQGESSTAAASSSVRLTEELDESGLSEETEVKVEKIEIGEEGFS